MNTTLPVAQVWERWKAAQRVALLATFEDRLPGQMRVKEFCRDCGPPPRPQKCQIIEHVWLFSTFRLRELQEIAAEEASTSDLVILSVHQAEGLPDEVKSWLELWLSHRSARLGIMLVLLDPVYEEAAEFRPRTYVQAVARRGGSHLLADTGDGPLLRW